MRALGAHPDGAFSSSRRVDADAEPHRHMYVRTKDSNPMTLEQLQTIVRHCTEQHAAPFYRRLYGLAVDAPAVELSSWREWEALPLFSKKELLDTPIRD